MRKESKLKKVVVCTAYLLLTIVGILSIFILISMTSNKVNDSIVRAQDSDMYFRNVNPRFLVDFVNNEYVRFETVSSFSNPFENEKQGIWERIKYVFGLRQEKKGIQISLIEVSYDTDLSKRFEERDINIPEYSLSKSFELMTSGREIGSENESTISKDTIISREIYKGVDLEYQIIKGKGLKEEIVLNELPEYKANCEEAECSLPVNRFVFKLDLDEGLTIRRSIDGNEEYPTGTFYIADKDGNYFAHFLPEFAVDGVGYKTSNVVSNILLSDSGEYIYEIILDPEWLLSDERVFPIRIDPSIIHDSDIVFNQGTYDRIQLDPAMTISLKSDEFKSGTYTSSIVDVGENKNFQSISWQGFAQATGSGEMPFSTLGLIYEENFNDILSDKKKWGAGSLQLAMGESKSTEIVSNESDYVTLEFWSYKRNLNSEQSIFSSNLGNLKISENKYLFEDVQGIQYESNIKVKYNTWQYVSLVFNISNSRVTLYIDELEYLADIGYSDQLTLNTLTYEGVGYIDTIRVYERLLARNELLSNSQYSNIYLQYMSSFDGLEWGEWYTKSKYVPTPEVGEKYIDIVSNEENIGNFDILSLEFLSDTSKDITLGTTKFSNGVDQEDILRLNQTEGSIEAVGEVKYLDLLITPESIQNSCILSLGGLEVYSLDTGKINVSFDGTILSMDDMYMLNEQNHIAVSLLENGSIIYLNGNILRSNSPYTVTPSQYSLGNGCSNSLGIFEGQIEEARISTVEKEESEILKYFHLSDRVYTLKPMFKAHLQSDTQILDMNTKTFNISEMIFGAPNHISNLHVGDTIVISEGGYSIEGIVVSLDEDTGFVTVDQWKEGGSIPELGFSTAAVILKWQTEYISTKTFLDTEGVINFVNMKYEDVKNIKNITFFSGLNADDAMSFVESSDRYVRYRFIYMTSKYGVSPYLSSVNIEYDSGGPGMDQIMRHGKWFDEGTQQSFWWVK